MEFKLPEIGEGVHEGELVRWLVKEGDVVKADQPLLEVMTDKATVEIPSPGAGKISNFKAKDGNMIKVGAVLATIDESAKGAAAPKAEAPAKAATPPPSPAIQTQAPSSVSSGSGGRSGGGVAALPMTAGSASSGAAPTSAPYTGALENLSASSVPAAPIVRAMAARAGVDLAQVPASGPMVGSSRRVLEEDLIKFLTSRGNGGAAVAAGPASFASAAPKPAPLPLPSRNAPAAAAGGEERQPLRGLRRVIAQAMVKSKYTAPHYSYVDEFECSSLVEMREQAKVIAEKYGIKFTYLPFVVKALVAALKEFPQCNSSLVDTAEGGLDLVVKRYYHIGFAVATDQGLLVPVIKNADQKTLLEIAQEMQTLSAKVRAGKASPDELKGSTFTITSMGNIGGLFATPIINYPEVGIMGVYKIQEKPLVKNGQIVIGKTMHLSLSLDHRVVDGAVGGQFCNAVIDRLANPAKLLLEMGL